jgi:hypothetical protein
VSSPLHDPDRPEPTDDVSIVPGLGPSGPLDMSKDPDRYDPAQDVTPYPATGPLDRSKDPDRYDPSADITAVGGPLDRSLDPDHRPPGQGQTLTDLLGEGAHEDTRDNLSWAYGLLGIIAFLAFVSWFFSSVATP